MIALLILVLLLSAVPAFAPSRRRRCHRSSSRPRASSPSGGTHREQAREEIERMPGSVDVITQKQIEQSRAANLKDVLEFTPGVMIRPRFGAATRASSPSAARGSATTSTCAASTS